MKIKGVILFFAIILCLAACSVFKTTPEDLISNEFRMDFVYIPPGTFVMGSPSYAAVRFDDETEHRVEITNGFYMQKTEVTQGQWKQVMTENPSIFQFKEHGDDYPVENVSWNDAQEFVKRLNDAEGSQKYRLPTEAEWEYVCRLGSSRGPFGDVAGLSDISRIIKRGIKIVTFDLFSTGDCLSTDQANYDGNYPLLGCKKGVFREITMPVASFPPNKLGLYDLHGNVNEWCQDGYEKYAVKHKTFPMYKTVDSPDEPKGGKYKVYRGGSWMSSAKYCRCAFRGREAPDYRNETLGLRLVKMLDE
ncbi:MAG: formylglycine-generating enzyme family protein [Thermodesulfobacteriota bacterium]